MRALALPCLLAVAAAVGCSASNTDEGAGGAPSGGSGQGGSGGGLFTGAGGGGTGGNSGGCSDAAKLIYVLSDENDLYSFRPDQKQFTLIGSLGCQTSMQPNSMAVDRDAVAYVNYVESDGFGDVDGGVFRVSTLDASCQPTSISLYDGWYRMGMGFSSDAAGGTAETLFVTGTDALGGTSPGLGRIDIAAGTLAPVGEFSGALNGANAELTGNGDGRLFGFFTTTPVQVAEIDKGSGGIVSTAQLQGVETPFAWAFSFWGGDFYLYTAPDPNVYPDRTSNVTRYRPSDGSVDAAYMTNVGFRIVGAGVSTCAPLAPPE